jgi:hypothetical protein
VHIFATLPAGDDGDIVLDAGVAIESVQELLDHKHITTTQLYDKRRRSVRIPPRTKCPYRKGVCLDLR